MASFPDSRSGAKFVVCLTTVAKRKDAERIARRLIAGRFAACVNIVPGLVSHYSWQGKACRDAEILLLVKTAASRVKRMEAEIRKIHPYELPEFIVIPIAGGSARYLRWIWEGVKSP